MIRVVLVDDQLAVRRGLRQRLTLEPDMTVAGEASDGRDAVALVKDLVPDVVLMDVEMPEMDGITAAAAIRVAIPQSAVIVLSIHDDASTQARAKEAGAAAFVHKSGEVEELIATIRQVAARQEWQSRIPPPFPD